MNKNRETLMKFISAQNQKVQNDISKQGYKRNSPYVNNPFNIIQGTDQGTPITMQDVDKPLIGIDSYGNKQYMQPGQEYYFPGPEVKEIALAKYGGLLNKTINCSNCGWSWKAADGGNDVSTCHKCGAENRIMQDGGPTSDMKSWFAQYAQSPLYRRNLESSGYEDVDTEIAKRLSNIDKTKYVLDENRKGTYYNPTSRYIHNAPLKDVENWKGNAPENESILAHEFGHSMITKGAGSRLNKYDVEQLGSRNKNKTSYPQENYADQKALQYEAAKLGIYNPGYEEFTKEHLNQLKNTGHKSRALENYSDDDLIWLINNVAQVDNQSQMPVAQMGGAGMMYADRNYQVGGENMYTVSGQPLVIPSQESYPFDYNKNLPVNEAGMSYITDKDGKKILLSSAIKVPTKDEFGKQLTRNQIAYNQDIWNDQKEAYSPDQQSFNIWKNNEQNTQQGYYNPQEYYDLVKKLNKRPDIGLEGLQSINQKSKSSAVSGSGILGKLNPLNPGCIYTDEDKSGQKKFNGGLVKYQTAGEVKEETYVIPESELQEVVVEPSEFSKYRIAQKKAKSWEEFANERYLGNFEKNMGQTINNLPAYRKQEYEDYIDKLAFDEYVKTHPAFKGESRGAYINRLESENANTPSFQRAYESNAPYNDATDINKWRKFLLGLGSVVVPKPAMDYMKQHSDYYSTKEKQKMKDSPYATQVHDVLGTLEPLTIPVEGLHSTDKSFGQIASGESADIPMSARLLGDPLMPLFEAAPLIGAGFKTVGRALGTEEGLLSNAYKINSNAEKLNDANKSYRVTGLDALEDFKNTGVVRSGDGSLHTFKFADLKGNFHQIKRPTGFPSFQKGYADMRYAPEEGAVVFETGLPTFKRGEINPVTGNRIRGRHYAHRVINPETGLTMTEIPAADVRVFGDKPHWWKGYQQIEVLPLTTEESALAKLGALRETSAPVQNVVQEAAVVKPWQMEELPGLHIKSTQTGSPLEKQLSKTGDINVNNITAHINKADVSQQDKFILDKVLKEKFPDQTKINYNDFRKAVSDELVILEKTFDDTYSSHGLEALGFNGTKKSSYEMAINNTKADIDTFTKKIAEYENKIKTNAEAVGGTSNENMLAGYKGRLKEAELQLAKNEAEYAKLPLENQTIVYGNKSGFGEGNAKHFPDKKEALGHARTLVTPEEPDIMHILESQSDYAQSAGNKIESLNPKIDKEHLLNKQKQLQEDEKLLNEYKYNYENNIPDRDGYKINKSQVDQLEQNFLDKKNAIELKLQNFKNPEQKNFFVKSHQERLLQENIVHAVEQGKTKMRYPTSETAVKNQGYEKIPFKWKRGEPVVLPNNKTGKMNNEVLWDDIINVIDENGKVIEVPANKFKELNPKFYNEDFSPKHKTIIKKYDEAPKMIKKTIGQDVRLVTDSNGNTWYEFDIPESFIQGKGEIRAFKQGGATYIKQKKALNWLSS